MTDILHFILLLIYLLTVCVCVHARMHVYVYSGLVEHSFTRLVILWILATYFKSNDIV